MRQPLTLLVASISNNQAALFLQELGAQVHYFPNAFVVDYLRSSIITGFMADAIVIDGTAIVYSSSGISPRGEEPLRASALLVQDILGLSSTVKMKNGIPWNELPIIVLVDEPYYEQFSRSYPGNSSSVTVCKVPFRPIGWANPIGLPYGWEKIYEVIMRENKRWTYEFVEKMHSRGWTLSIDNGLKTVNYQSKKHDYDMKRLSPIHTRLISDIKMHGTEEEVRIARWDLTEAVLEELEGAVKIGKHVREYWFQRLFTENPYLLGASSFELIPHLSFTIDPSDKRFTRKRQILDFLRTPYPFSLTFSDPYAIEIKRPDTPVVRIENAVRQALPYTNLVKERRGGYAGKPLIISSLSNAKNFQSVRLQSQELADILGYDDISERAVQRYTFVPSEDLISIYSTSRNSYKPV
jgi:hypothetical protein